MVMDKKRMSHPAEGSIFAGCHALHVAFIQAIKQQVDLILLLIGLKQILQVKQDVQCAAGSLCLPLCGVCPVSTNLGVTGLTTPPLVV